MAKLKEIVPPIREEWSDDTEEINPCRNTCDGYTCTRPKGHKGVHKAHGSFSVLLAEWED